MTHRTLLYCFVLSSLSCGGRDGAEGPQGPAGTQGAAGAMGTPGAMGTNGAALPPSSIALPGDGFFPENIYADKAGNLYVSSLATGGVVKIDGKGFGVTQFLQPEIVTSNPLVVIGKTGLLVDDARNELLACAVNTTTFASTLRRYDIATGAEKARYPMGNGGQGLCNDMALDAAGNLYIANSFFGVERLKAGAAALEVWNSDPLLRDSTSLGADGIVVDGQTVWVNNVTSGALIRIDIAADGTSQKAIAVQLKDTQGAPFTLSGPDGMRLSAPNTLVIAESTGGSLSQVAIDKATNTAIRKVISNRLDTPSSVAIVNGTLWVAEGQIGRLFKNGPTPVRYPFLVQRVESTIR